MKYQTKLRRHVSRILLCGASVHAMVLAGACTQRPELPFRMNVVEPVCGDFLGIAGKKPAHLEFSGCERRAGTPSDTLVASYRVPGNHAASVEDYLVGLSGMPRLRFLCCLWESAPVRPGNDPQSGSYINSVGQQFSIGMYSDETVHIVRDKWNEIPGFRVWVELDMEEP